VAAGNEDIRPGPFKTTPLMVGGLVYLSTALGQVAALDAGSGETAWTYAPGTYYRLDRRANMGWQHRGVSYWEDEESDDARISIATHDLLLIAMNARTGALCSDFGRDGAVDLSQGLGRAIDRFRLTHSQPVAIAGNTVIVGSIVQDTSLTRREADTQAMCVVSMREVAKGNGYSIRFHKVMSLEPSPGPGRTSRGVIAGTQMFGDVGRR